ncbi:energy transducer TonB [Acidisoma sp. 7E03]
MTAAHANGATAVPDALFANSIERTPGSRVALWGSTALLVLAAHLAFFVVWRPLVKPAGQSVTAPPAVMIDLSPLPTPPAPAAPPRPVAAVPAPSPAPPKPVETTPPPPPAAVTPAPPAPRDLPEAPSEATLPLPPPPAPLPPRPQATRLTPRRTAPTVQTPERIAVAPTTAPAPAAAPPQSAPSAGVARRDWQSRLLAHIARYKSYPALAQDSGWEGTSLVRFTFRRDGTLVSAILLRSAGHAVLDQAALATLRRASPLPPPPAAVTGDTLTLTLPLQFSLQPG